ncbi:hypothetical protein Zmor_012635 [Zophobas morio]|uniref:Uncharacterized protein n=1 Tax=Zophobas morio TaxID=2755281 RepID=A0AA38IFS8_9CUCU|nr:hypothetical protein Zmor_012635 [Zophobas morio]
MQDRCARNLAAAAYKAAAVKGKKDEKFDTLNGEAPSDDFCEKRGGVGLRAAVGGGSWESGRGAARCSFRCERFACRRGAGGNLGCGKGVGK